jgi:hypothetical protein
MWLQVWILAVCQNRVKLKLRGLILDEARLEMDFVVVKYKVWAAIDTRLALFEVDD